MFIITLNTHIPLHVPKCIMKKCTLCTPSYSNCCVPFYTPSYSWSSRTKVMMSKARPVNSPFGNYTCLFTLSAFVLKYALPCSLLYLGSLHFGGAPSVMQQWELGEEALTPKCTMVYPTTVKTCASTLCRKSCVATSKWYRVSLWHCNMILTAIR